jgi:hypothetical protein
VVRIGQRHHAAAGLLRALDAQRHRLLADDLAVAALAVHGQQAAAIELHFDAGVRLQPAFEHRVDVARHHADAMRVVPAQVGQHQVVGDGLRFLALAAGGGDDGRDGARSCAA